MRFDSLSMKSHITVKPTSFSTASASGKKKVDKRSNRAAEKPNASTFFRDTGSEDDGGSEDDDDDDDGTKSMSVLDGSPTKSPTLSRKKKGGKLPGEDVSFMYRGGIDNSDSLLPIYSCALSHAHSIRARVIGDASQYFGAGSAYRDMAWILPMATR